MNPSDEEIKTTEEEEKTSQDEVDTSQEEIDTSAQETSLDIEEEFKGEVKYPREAEATSEEELRHRMKLRILKSFKWQKDIIIPFSEELNITQEELEEILMRRMDMSSLVAIHPRFESSRLRCTLEKIHSDLKLCWLSDVMDLLTREEAEDIKHKTAFKILKEDVHYEKALEEGRKEIVEYLKR